MPTDAQSQHPLPADLQARLAAELPPVMRAVMAFILAPDDAAAEAIFSEQKVLLQPYEAQQVLDALVAQDEVDLPVAVRERLAGRHALLRRPLPRRPLPAPHFPRRPR